MRPAVFVGNLRVLISRHLAEMGATNLFLLFMLAVITFYPLIFVGFTTNDDATLAINFGNPSVWQIAKILSEMQGRFTFFWGYPLLQVPYIVDSRVWYLALKFGSFFLLFGALFFAVFQSFRSNWIALVSLLFFLTFIQNGWDHNALTSYPFAINFYAALFLVSLGIFAVTIDRKSLALAGVSAGLYFFALGVELFVLFFPFYVAVLLSRATPSESFKKRLMSGKKYLLAVVVALLAYLSIYLVWRTIYPSGYDGNSLNGLSLLATGKVVVAYSLNAFPLASVSFMLSPEQRMLFTDTAGLREMLSELNASHFIKPAVVSFLFVRLMSTAHFIVPQARTLLIGAVLACVGIFLPNMLLGFVQRHQAWVAAGSHSYLYTYYSFISAVVFSALVVAYMNVKSRSWHPKLRLALILIGTIVIMAFSFAVEVRNQYIAFDQKLSHRKWQLMDVVIKSPAFMEIPDGSIVVAPTLTAHHRGIAQAPAEYWSKYVKYKTGKNVQFVDDNCRSEVPCYALVFRQESHSDNQFIVLAKIKHPDLLLSSDLTIYSMPKQASAVLVGSFVSGEVSPKLEINGTSVANVGTALFSSDLPYVSGNELVQTARVAGNVEIFPDQMTISHYSIVPRLRPFSVELGDGFYGWETSAGQPTWAWSKDTSTLHVTNYDRKAIVLTVKFEATSLENIELHMSGVVARSFKLVPGVYRPIEFEFVAQPGVTRIDLLSDRQSIQPINGDPRFLSFSIRGLYVQNH